MERKRSNLWRYFRPIPGIRDTVKCDICHSRYSIKGGNVTNLKKHLMSKHGRSYLDESYKSIPITVVPFSSPISSEHQYEHVEKMHVEEMNLMDVHVDEENDCKPLNPSSLLMTPEKNISNVSVVLRRRLNVGRERKINDLVLKMIIKDLQPFSIVNDSGFHDLINYLEPNYKIPSKQVLSTTLLDAQYSQTKENIKNDLKLADHITLTTEGWSSRDMTSYLAVTAHYISGEPWELRSAFLGCFECHDRHTTNYLKQELVHLTESWEINGKIFMCVTNEATKLKAAVKSAGWEHITCIAHTMNLIVNAGLVVIQDLLKKARSIVEHFQRSPVAKEELMLMQQLKENEKPLKLKMDDNSSWNSALDMLERIKTLQRPLELALGIQDKSVKNLSEDEWVMLPEIIRILKPFKTLTEELSSHSEVSISKVLGGTNSIIRILHNLRSNLKTSSGLSKNLIDTLNSELNTQFKSNQHSMVLSKAALLDPRFKMQSFKNESQYINAKRSLQAEIERKSSMPEDFIKQEFDPYSTSREDEEDIWSEHDKNVALNSSISTISAAMISIQQYMEEKEIPRKDNPLEWWNSRKMLYPEIANLAKKYLSVMVAAVPSERIFSKSGQIFNEKRSALKSKRMEKMLFLNANQKFNSQN